MKVETYVRFPNSDYYQRITVDPRKLETKSVLKEEVFVEIDGVTVAMKKNEYDTITDPLFLYLEENYPINKDNI
jgi:uncharacterized protein YuzE